METQDRRTRLAKKGAKHSLESLISQAAVSLSLVDSHGERLAQYGFSAEDQALLRKLNSEMSASIGAQRVDVVDADLATRGEAAARDEAKAFIRTLRLAVPIVARSTEHPELTLKSFRAGRKLRRSSSRIHEYLVGLRPLLVKLEDPFRPFFAGASAVERLDEVDSRLSEKNGVQEFRRAHRSIATFALNLAKGQFLQQVEDLNRVGKIAFADNPIIAAQFDKRVMQRGKRKRVAAQGSPAEAPAAEAAALVQAAAAAAPPIPEAKTEAVAAPATAAAITQAPATTRSESQPSAPYFAVASVRAYEDGEPTTTPPGRPPSG